VSIESFRPLYIENAWTHVSYTLSSTTCIKRAYHRYRALKLFENARITEEECRTYLKQNFNLDEIEKIADLYQETVINEAGQNIIRLDKFEQRKAFAFPNGVESFNGNLFDLDPDLREIVINSLYARANLSSSPDLPPSPEIKRSVTVEELADFFDLGKENDSHQANRTSPTPAFRDRLYTI